VASHKPGVAAMQQGRENSALYVLATLLFSTRGEIWKIQNAWMTDDADECDWHTSETQCYICNFVGEVDKLDLVRNNSVRSIPRMRLFLNAIRSL
jgi:pyrroloquinoline quinone (PQQ) biosynthesis protein C